MQSHDSGAGRTERGWRLPRWLLWASAITVTGFSLSVIVGFVLFLKAASHEPVAPQAVYNVQRSGWGSIYMPTCPGENVSDIWITSVLPQPNSTPATGVHLRNPTPASEFTYDLQQLLWRSATPTQPPLEYPSAAATVMVHLQVRTTIGRDVSMHFHPNNPEGWQQSSAGDTYSTGEDGRREIRDALQCGTP